ncbi:hypothetical protein BGX26_011291 [Mortierella sp. AD094]|nr:hypothetical protein BGX26_011291 [Mortierella sp. AD094]
MVSKISPMMLTDEQQYLAIEQTLTRAGFDHEAYIEDRPKTNCGSLIFSMMNASIGHGYGETRGGGYNPVAANGSIVGGKMGGSIATGASSICGGVSGAGNNSGGGLQMYSPVSPGSFSHKRYTNTVRSSTSSLLSLGRPRSEPPVMILPHYNSPYEALYFNQPDVLHFVGKDLKFGTVCISAKQGQGVMHFLVRTVLKFANVDILESCFLTPEFEQCRSLYPKKNDLYPMLHVALQQCLESIPEIEVNRHQVVRHQSGADHSVFVLDDPGWLQSPRYISNIVSGLEEIKQEGFTFVLKNLEAQMRPAALMLDIVIPNKDAFTESHQEKFWTFFNGLGDHIEAETYLPHAPKIALNMPTMVAGNKSEEQRLEAVAELIETETSYNKRMQDLVNIYLKEARLSVTALNPPLGKYEIRVIFSNIEQIVTASTDFLNDLREYQNCGGKGMNLGDICRKNLRGMECYKQYLMRYKRAQDAHSALTKKCLAYRALQDKCLQASGVQTVSNLLIEPTQRIVKYPLLFKAILSGTNEDSTDVEGLRDAAEIASQFAHMEKAKPEQRAEMLFNIRSIIENCPDSLLSQNRSIITYLDGYETNLLTGEKGRPITIILFSDKVMIVRRPKGMSGDALFHLKEDEEQRKRREKEKKKKDGTRPKKDDSCDSESTPTTGAQGAGGVMSGFNILRKDWKFMGWTDLLKIKFAIVEQTDPEGLFCITTRYHTETKDDLWETTRGIMPEVLDKRDIFISKFYETQSLFKASAVSSGIDQTSRLHVAELELFCNVFTENQYRDFEYKGDVSLFYTTTSSSSSNIPNYPVDVTPFPRLPPFVGMIQAAESGFRAVLRSKANLNGAGDSVSTTEDANRFLDSDAFQIQVTELVANLLWTAYNFDPYQSAQLHVSRVYMDTDYLYKTANPFTKAATLRTKGLKMLRETTGNTSSSTSFALPARSNSSSSSQHHIPGYRHGGSFSPLTSPCDMPPNGPTSPSGGGLVGRNNSIVYSPNPGYASSSSINSITNNNYNGNGMINNNGMDMASMSPTVPNKRFSMPVMPVMMRRKRADSVATCDSADSDNSGGMQQYSHHQPPLPPNHPMAANAVRNSVSVMNLLIPNIEVLRLELLNYSSAIAFDILRIYFEEGYEHGPLVGLADVRAKMGDCLVYHRDGQMRELITLRSQEFLDDMHQYSRFILGIIVSHYSKLLDLSVYEGYHVELAIKFCSLVGLKNDVSPSKHHDLDIDGSQKSEESEKLCNRESPIPHLAFEEEQFLLMEIWVQYYHALWPDRWRSDVSQRIVLPFSSDSLLTPLSPTSSMSHSDTLYSLEDSSTSTSGVIRKVASMPLDGFSSSMSGARPANADMDKRSSNSRSIPHSISMSNIHTKAYHGYKADSGGGDGYHQAPSQEGKSILIIEEPHWDQQQHNDQPLLYPQGHGPYEDKLSMFTRLEEWQKLDPSAVENKTFESAVQCRDNVEVKALQSDQSIKTLKSEIELLRNSIADEHNWMDGQLKSLAEACSSGMEVSKTSSTITSASEIGQSGTITGGNVLKLIQKLNSPQTSHEKTRAWIKRESPTVNRDRYQLQQGGRPHGYTRVAPRNPQAVASVSTISQLPPRSSISSIHTRPAFAPSTLPFGAAARTAESVPSLRQQLSQSSIGTTMSMDSTLSVPTSHGSTDCDDVKMLSNTTGEVESETGESRSIGDNQINDASTQDSHNGTRLRNSSRIGERPLPLTPLEKMMIRNRNLALKEQEQKRSNQDVAGTNLLSHRVRELQSQNSVKTEQNLEVLDRYLNMAEKVGQEFAAQWEFMQRQYEDLVNQLEISKAYQAKLEQENETIKDLYDEATEENNVIFEKFNGELENIFEAVNAGTITSSEILNMRAEKKAAASF